MKQRSEGRWPPRKCDMPDLSQMDHKQSISLLLGVFFQGAYNNTPPGTRSLVISFVRLLDQSLQSYKSARAELIGYIDTRSLSQILRVSGHLETLINSMYRAMRFARRIERRQLKTRDGNYFKLTPAEKGVLRPNIINRIKRFRDAIEHMDERIIKNTIGENEPIALQPMSDAIALTTEEGYEEIFYQELADWINQLYGLGKRLTEASEFLR